MDTTTIYLHIGTNKTGTSAIQRHFNRQREALAAHGLLYPVTGCSGEAHYGVSAVLGFEHRKSPQSKPNGTAMAELRHSLMQEIEASACRRVLISSENFVLPRAVAPVREFLRGFEVRIVVYLRRHDSWWESAYNQAVKMVAEPPWGRGFERYLRFNRMRNPHYGDYRRLLNRWAEVFGQDNIIVRPYERQQNEPNVAVDLLQAIGCGALAARSEIRLERINESLHADTLHLIDVFQRARIGPELRQRLIEHVIATGQPGGGGSLLEPALRRRLVDERSQDYAYIARTYLGRRDGRLFYDPLPDPDEPWAALPKPAPTVIVETMAQVLGAASPSDGVRSVA